MGAVSGAAEELHALAVMADQCPPHNTRLPWQFATKSLADRARYLLEESDTLCDVVIVVGKGAIQQEIPCHKFMLAMGSPMFQTMFYGPTRQIADGADLYLPEIEPAAFRNLLRYFYLDDINGLDEDNVIATLHAAKKFEVPHFRAACLEYMQTVLRPDNVFVILEQARQYGEVELVHRCVGLIDKKTYAVIKTPGFLDIDVDTLGMMLSRDELTVREVDLYNAVVKWAEKECERQDVEINCENMRKVSEDVIKHIRFPLMTAGEIADGPVQSGLLSPEEVTELFLYLFASDKPEIRFRSNPRREPCGQELVLERFTELGCSWGYAGGPDAIRVQTDRDIALLGVGLYGTDCGQPCQEVALKIFEMGKGGSDIDLVYEEETVISSTDAKISRFMLKEMVSFKAGTTYTISTLIKGSTTYSGANGAQAKKVFTGPNDTGCVFQFFEAPDSQNGTCVSCGQIPQLIYAVSS